MIKPAGSIAYFSYDDSRIAYGSGAYSVTESSYGSISLTRNEDWWNNTFPSTENITFPYVPDGNQRTAMADGGALDWAVTDYAHYYPYQASDSLSWSSAAGNPVTLLFNVRQGLINDLAIRKALCWVIYNWAHEVDMESNYHFALQSNDFWICCPWDPYYPLKSWSIEDVRNLLDELDYKLSIDLLTTQKYAPLANKIQNKLENHIDVCITVKGERVFDDEVQDDAFDVALGEIDLLAVNSDYTYFYDKINNNVNQMLQVSKIAADTATYGYVHKSVQLVAIIESAMVNLGWDTKMIARQSDIVGFSVPG